MRIQRLPDDEFVSRARAARPHKPGARTEEVIAIARELLKRPHLLLAVLLESNPHSSQASKSILALRGVYPCLTKDEAAEGIKDMMRRTWLRPVQGTSIVELVQRDLEAARREVEAERSTRGDNRPSDPPPAQADSTQLPLNWSRRRIFDATFPGWGSPRHLKLKEKGRVVNESIKSVQPHLRAYARLQAQKKRSWTIELVVEALKVLVAEKCMTVVGGSFEKLDELVLSPLKRPDAIIEPRPSPKLPVAPAKEPTKAPPTEVKKPAPEVKPPPRKPSAPEVVVKTPPKPAGPKLTAKEQLVIDALRLKKLKADGTIEGPVSFTQFNVLHGTRDETIKVLIALIRKRLLTAEFKADKTPNWNTVRVIKVASTPKVATKPAPVEVAPVVVAPAPVVAEPELSLEERVSQMILPTLSQNPLMVELGARHRAELEEVTTRHERELQELVIALVTKAVERQMG